MKTYSYKALDASRKTVQGELHAESDAQVELYFRERKLLPVQVVEQRPDPVKLVLDKMNVWWNQKRIRTELITFTRQFAAAYAAGMQVSAILDLLGPQCETTVVRRALERISADIKTGKGLVDSFSAHPDIFDNTYRALLTTGEMTGNLDMVMNYAAGLLEKKAAHDERIKSTLLYPKIVVGAILVTVVVVLTFVIPQFKKIFDRFEAELPLPTVIMVQMSDFFTKYWWGFVLAIPGYILAIEYLKRRDDFMLWFDERLLKVPILGLIFQKAELTHFCTTFALMMRAGIKITDATRIAIRSLRNSYLRQELSKIIAVIESGGTLSGALKEIAVVPPLMSSMVSVGEHSGTLDQLLDRVAAMYDNETETLLKKLPTYLEPIILSVLFGMVLFIALAVYLPMWRMSSLLKR